MNQRRFQRRIEEIEEFRTTDDLAQTSLTGRGRVRSNVPEPLANRLGSLTSEAGVAAPAAPSSDVRKMHYKADMIATLNMNMLTSRADARRMMDKDERRSEGQRVDTTSPEG